MQAYITERIRKVVRDRQGKIHKNCPVYDAYYSYKDAETGKMKKTCKRGFLKKTDAEAYLDKIRYELYTNTYSSQRKMLVRKFCEEWLEAYKPHIRESTYVTYKRIIDQHIVPHIGNEYLTELTPLKIDKMYASLLSEGRLDHKGGLSATFVRHVHRVLYEALNYAVKHRLTAINPAKDATCPRPKKYHAKVYTTKEILNLLEIGKEDPCIEAAVALAAICGMRRGEILALTVEDVNFDEKSIHIEKQYVEVDKKAVTSRPKSEESNRIISAPQKVFDILRKRIEENARTKALIGEEYTDNRLIVCYDNGMPIRPRTFTKRFSFFLEKHHLRKIRFHDLRHSAVTMMIHAGIPLKTISSIAGHSNIGTTADIYAHTLSEDKKEAALQIDRLFLPEEGKDDQVQ